MAKGLKEMMAPGTMMGDIMIMQRSLANTGNDKKKRRRMPPVPTQPAGSVVANLQKLIREGYLKQSDFGWFAPSAIRPYVEGVETVGAACSK